MSEDGVLFETTSGAAKGAHISGRKTALSLIIVSFVHNGNGITSAWKVVSPSGSLFRAAPLRWKRSTRTSICHRGLRNAVAYSSRQADSSAEERSSWPSWINKWDGPTQVKVGKGSRKTHLSPSKSAPQVPRVDSELLRFLSSQRFPTSKVSTNFTSSNSSTTEKPGVTGTIENDGDSDSDDSMGTANDVAKCATPELIFPPYTQSNVETNFALAARRISSPTVAYLDQISQMENIQNTPHAAGTRDASSVMRECLVALGADEQAINDAIKSVLLYAMESSARRRIRRYLRRRDILWSADNSRQQPTLQSSDLAEETEEVSSSSAEIPLQAESLVIERFEDCVSVLCDAGLTGKDIATIVRHTPAVAVSRTRRSQPTDADCESMHYSLESILERVMGSLLTSKFKLRRYDARKVLRSCPGLLTRRGSQSADDVVTILSSLGVSTNSLGRDQVNLPSLLTRSPSSLFRIIAFLSGDAVCMPFKRIGTFLRGRGSSALLDVVAPSLNTLMAQEVEDGDEVQRRLVDQTYAKMASTARLMRESVGLPTLGNILSACPHILLEDPRKVLAVVNYLCRDVGMPAQDMSKVLQTYPSLLSGDLTRVEEVVNYLLSLEVSKDALQSMFRAFPSLLMLDVEADMKPVVDFLQSIGVNNVPRFITRLPPVLGYSVEMELVPKWKFISKICGFDSFEVVRFPAYFSYPLDRVILSRYEYLIKVKRLPANFVGVDAVLRHGDAEFATRIAGDKDGGDAFARFVEERKQRRKSGRNTGSKQKRRNRERKRRTDKEMEQDS